MKDRECSARNLSAAWINSNTQFSVSQQRNGGHGFRVLDPELIRRIKSARNRASERLLAERTADGHWRGELSASALSTATAILALAGLDRVRHAELIQGGLLWLRQHQHESGGWGDTVASLPNISTTMLCWAAFGATSSAGFSSTVEKAESWIRSLAGSLQPSDLATVLEKRYGRDKTFSVPILMACALGGRLGASPGCWDLVPQLPCQLAALPRRWFAAMSLPVVSYALPALIAIGHVRHFHQPTGFGRILRDAAKDRTLRLLREIQPTSGGYLEATPLTSFVTMALASMGLGECEVARQGAEFLGRAVRPDGSWPIDTDLATWVTTLSVKALAHQSEFLASAGDSVLPWLLGQQYREQHPYTLSAPGGWAWTDLPGGVPDADDTSGALIALDLLGDRSKPDVMSAAVAGVRWLLGLQNRDGGMPTFCRGWGTLPFDRSTPEITAHALAAWAKWPQADARLPAVSQRALHYLSSSQRSDGSWEPLWFGNQFCREEINHVYGTAATLRDLCAASPSLGSKREALCSRAARYLVSVQQASGGWAGGLDAEAGHCSIEETAVSLHALAAWVRQAPEARLISAISGGVEALLHLTGEGTEFTASPIGLYFARLWYFERLYPLAWTTSAFSAVSSLSET